jgi:hypothetical protein
MSPRGRRDEPPLRYEWERIVKASTLTAPVKHTALTVATYTDGDGTGAYPGTERLVRDTSLSDKTVRRALETLRDVGLLVRTVVGSSQGRRGVADEYCLAIPVDLIERLEVRPPQRRTPVTRTGDKAPKINGTPVTGTGDPGRNTGHTFPEHRSDVPGTPVTRSGNTGTCDRPPDHYHSSDHTSDQTRGPVVDVPTDRARVVPMRRKVIR